MRPDFALTLSHEAIGLWRRADAGWEELGMAPLSDPQLDARLAELRDAAARAAGGPFFTKVLIPDSEVLVTTLKGAPKDEADLVAWIGREIEGLTPYAAGDLVFDWEEAPDGGLRVAVAAREILVEAEAFAHAHQFNPVSVVGNGRGDAFAGEPFFGPAEVAQSLLPAGATVERDPEPLHAAPAVDAAAEAAESPLESEEAPPVAPSAEAQAVREGEAEPAESEAGDAEVVVPPPEPAQSGAEPAPLPDAGPEPQPQAEPGAERGPASETVVQPDVAVSRVEQTQAPPEIADADEPAFPATPDNAGSVESPLKPEVAEEERAEAGVIEAEGTQADGAVEGSSDHQAANPSTPDMAEVPADEIRVAMDRARDDDDAPVPDRQSGEPSSQPETGAEVSQPPDSAVTAAAPAIPEKLAAALERFQDRPASPASPAMPAALAKAVLSSGKRRAPVAERAEDTGLPPRPVAPLSGATRNGGDDPFAGLGTRVASARVDGAKEAPGEEQRARAARAFDSVPEIDEDAATLEPVVEFGPAVFASRRDPKLARREPSAKGEDTPVRFQSPASGVEAPAPEPAAAGDAPQPVTGPLSERSAPAAWQRVRSAVAGLVPSNPRRAAQGEAADSGPLESAPEPPNAVPADQPAGPRRVEVPEAGEPARDRRGLRGAADLAGMVASLGKRSPRGEASTDAKPGQITGADGPEKPPSQDRRSAPLPQRQPTVAESPMSEADALTIFGARRQTGIGRKGTGSLGVVVIGLLVLVLAAVALWAAFFLRDGTGTLAVTEAPPADSVPAEVQGTIAAPEAIAPVDVVEGFDPALLPLPDVDGPDLAMEGPFNIDEPATEAVPLEDAATVVDTPVPDTGTTPGFAAVPDLLPSLGGAPEAATAAPPPRTTDATGPSDAALPPPMDAPGPADIAAAMPEEALPSAVGEAQAEPEAAVTAADPLPELSAEELAAAYPETGIWPFAPDAAPAPVSRRLDDLFFSAVDGAAPPSTIAELPPAGLALRDENPRPAAPPPPPGSFAPADTAGAAQVVAEPVASVPVTMSAPPVVPPSRADTLPPVPVLAAPDPPPVVRPQPRPAGSVPPDFDSGATETVPEPAQPETQRAATAPDPALAGAATLPAEVVAVALPAATPDEAAAEVPLVVLDAAAEALRPQLRPGTPEAESRAEPLSVQSAALAPEDDVAAGEGAVRTDETAPAPVLVPRPRPSSLEAVAAAAVPQPEDPFASASALAVAASLRPSRRPAGFAQLAAQRQAASAAPVQTAAAATAAPAPTAQPSLPTRASVADQATQARAVNLRDVNLIGVFGTCSDRRALVRLSNGQIITVRVGDRLDGGQVAAIGDSELRYVRNGRNEVLRVGG